MGLSEADFHGRAETAKAVPAPTLMERITTLEKQIEIRARAQLEQDEWLRRLYVAVGLIYPGDEPRER